MAVTAWRRPATARRALAPPAWAAGHSVVGCRHDRVVRARWRDCAAKYAAGESMKSADTVDTVDVIVEMTIAVVLAVVVIWSLLGVL